MNSRLRNILFSPQILRAKDNSKRKRAEPSCRKVTRTRQDHVQVLDKPHTPRARPRILCVHFRQKGLWTLVIPAVSNAYMQQPLPRLVKLQPKRMSHCDLRVGLSVDRWKSQSVQKVKFCLKRVFHCYDPLRLELLGRHRPLPPLCSDIHPSVASMTSADRWVSVFQTSENEDPCAILGNLATWGLLEARGGD